MTAITDSLVATRTIAAPPAQIFAILIDPSRHQDTEPGDWVRAAVDNAPITATGQMFAMNMFHEQAGGHYVMHNLVTVFDKDRAIGWVPGQLDDAGNYAPGGWLWRYDLAPNGDRTDVSLTYDWSAMSQDRRDQFGGMPVFPEDYLAASLITLERTVTSAK
jgi:hypothetical protein